MVGEGVGGVWIWGGLFGLSKEVRSTALQNDVTDWTRQWGPDYVVGTRAEDSRSVSNRL